MRRQPVAFALIDAAFLADSKWRKLGKRLPEPTAFNSALGAWLRILTAARRNGLPAVDSVEESEDPTYLPDLIAVGLLTETGIPEKPYRAWAPARPKYPSDTDAPNVPSATSYSDHAQEGPDSPQNGVPSATDAPGSPFMSTGAPSTPFTSTLSRGPRAGAIVDEQDWTEDQRQAAYIAAQQRRTGVA